MRLRAAGETGAGVGVVAQPAHAEIWAVSYGVGFVDGGESVQIVGVNLPSNPSVSFGSASASVSSATSSEIVAVSPAAATDGFVDVTISGTGGTLVTPYLYLQEPPPGAVGKSEPTLNVYRMRGGIRDSERDGRDAARVTGRFAIAGDSNALRFDPVTEDFVAEFWVPEARFRAEVTAGDARWMRRPGGFSMRGVDALGVRWRIRVDNRDRSFTVRIDRANLPSRPGMPCQVAITMGESYGFIGGRVIRTQSSGGTPRYRVRSLE